MFLLFFLCFFKHFWMAIISLCPCLHAISFPYPPHANGKKSNTKVEYIRERGVWSFAAAKRLGEYYTIMYVGNIGDRW